MPACHTDTETDAQPDVVEYFVSLPRMDTVRQHRFERTAGDDGEYLSVQREWAWDYVAGAYTERRNTMTITVTPDGTVEHDGRPLEAYAEARVDILTDKRFGRHPEREGVEVVRTR